MLMLLMLNIWQEMTQEKLKAFRLGSINTQLSKAAPFTKKKELREERKRVCFP